MKAAYLLWNFQKAAGKTNFLDVTEFLTALKCLNENKIAELDRSPVRSLRTLHRSYIPRSSIEARQGLWNTSRMVNMSIIAYIFLCVLPIRWLHTNVDVRSKNALMLHAEKKVPIWHICQKIAVNVARKIKRYFDINFSGLFAGNLRMSAILIRKHTISQSKTKRCTTVSAIRLVQFTVTRIGEEIICWIHYRR